MKTQIINLRSGSKNQFLNSNVDYSTSPKATSHVGHAGTNNSVCLEVWDKVKSENPDFLKVLIFGEELKLKANWSLSKKSVTYFTTISEDFLSNFPIMKSSNTPTLQIDFANSIVVSNGKNSNMTICPSLVTII